MKVSKKNTFKKLLLILVFVVCISTCLFGCNMLFGDDSINDYITQELESEEFNSLSDSEQVERVSDLLEYAEKTEQIKEYSYDSKHNLFTFTYSDDGLGGIDLSETQTDKYGVESKCESDTSNTIYQIVKPNKAYAASSGKKIHIMYSLEDQFKQSFQDWEDRLNNKGLYTSVDYDTTVEDLKHLGGYDATVLSMHGSVYNGRPVLCLKEEVTYEKNEEYISEIMYHNIASVYIKNEGFHYWVLPQFFSSNYNNNELDNSIVLSQCCDFLSDSETHPSEPDLSFPNNFFHAGAKTVTGFYNPVNCSYSDSYVQKMVDYMYDGDLSANDAHAKTLNDIGNNDGDNPPGTPYLFGNKELSLGDPAARIAKEKAEKEAATKSQKQTKETSKTDEYTATGTIHVGSSYYLAKNVTKGRTCGTSKNDIWIVLELDEPMDVYAKDGPSKVGNSNEKSIKKSVKYVSFNYYANTSIAQQYSNKNVKVTFKASYFPDFDQIAYELCDVIGTDLKLAN